MAESFLQPPSWSHWFGTDLAGKDVFQSSLIATGLELTTLAVVAVALHALTLAVVGLFSASSNRWLRVALPQATHLWSTLPHLLLVTLLVVLIGPGQLQLMVSLLVALLAAHVAFTIALFWEAERQDFITAKLALGLPHRHVLAKDVVVWVHRRLMPFSRARLPEIVMLHLAQSFLGFGIRPPAASLGRMIFDGLPFMFAAWWLWIFPAVLAGVVLLGVTTAASKVDRMVMNDEATQ